MIKFDYSKLRGKMREKELRQDQVAKMIGISPATYSQKLNNKAYFTQDEISDLVKILSISSNDIGTYFFTLKV